MWLLRGSEQEHCNHILCDICNMGIDNPEKTEYTESVRIRQLPATD